MTMRSLDFTLNGRRVNVEVGADEILLNALRGRLGIKSVKEGCSIGECGVCTVLIDDEPHYSCLTLASKVHGRDVKTVEFLGSEGALHPLQEAFIAAGAVQCGYCTPGMLLSAYSLLLKNQDPDEWSIRESVSGNLCRCTGYVQIIEAVRKAAKVLRSQKSEFWSQEKDRNGESEIRQNGAGQSSEARVAKTPVPSKGEILSKLTGMPGIKIIAGGTDFLIKARKGGDPFDVIDVTRIHGLNGIEEMGGKIWIGAATTHAKIAYSVLIREAASSLSTACGLIGSSQIRNMGTIGGNLVNASPAADSLPPLLIHDGVLRLESTHGVREMSLEEFIVAPYRTAIKAGELVTSVNLTSLMGYREGYRRVTKRAALAISRLSIAWAIKANDATYVDVRLAIGSCTPMPFRARDVEGFLAGKERSPGMIDEAVKIVLDDIVKASGMRPSYVYKLPVLRDLLTNILKG
jgi:xanthine dehydrogenase small subunit